FLKGGNRLATAAIAGLVGFGLALVVLSIAAERSRKDWPNNLAPPAAVRRPILTAIVSVWPMLWVLQREVMWPGLGTVVGGGAAEVIGIVGSVVIVCLLGLANVRDYRREGIVASSMVLSLGVAMIALAIAGIAIGR